MKCYFDGSYGKDSSGDEWITLAGLAAADSVWQSFEDRWHTMLRSRYPVAPYIHMIEILDREDPFDRVNGWTEEKYKALIQDAIILLSQVRKDQFLLVRCSFNKSARERLVAEDITHTDGIDSCAIMCSAMTAGIYLANTSDPEPITFCFDRGERFFALLKKRWLSRRTAAGSFVRLHNAWDAFDSMEEKQMSHCYPLQASDMIAWAHTRTLPGHPERPFSYMKEWLLKCIPSLQLDVTEELMRRQAVNPTSSARSLELVLPWVI